MRILYIQQILTLPESAGNDRCWEFACHWRDAGHEVQFLTTAAGFPAEARRRPGTWERDGISLCVLKGTYRHRMAFPRRIISFLEFFFRGLAAFRQLAKPDVVVAYSAPLSTGELGRRLAAKWKVPFVFEVADVWPDVPAGMGIIPQGPLLRWLYARTQRIYRAAAAIVVFTPDMKKQVCSHGVPAEKVHVAWNGIGRYAAETPFNRQKTAAPPVVLYLGTVGVANGLAQLAAAMALLERQGAPEFTVRVIGQGNDEQAFRSALDKVGSTRIEWQAQIPRKLIAEALASAEVGVVSFAPFPVLEANGATKFFDYLAAGLPVVINYRGWQAEWLAAHQCGLSSDQGDVAGFAANLRALIEDADLRLAMGHRGRAAALAQFDRRQAAKAELDLICAAAAAVPAI